MSKLSQKDKMMLVIVGAIAVLGGLYWFYVRPAKADLGAAEIRVQAAQDSVDGLRSQISRLVAQSSGKGAGKPVAADQLRLAKAYPTDRNVPQTILEIERIARRSGVTLDDATPDDGTDYAGVTGTAFSITVSGTFLDVADFTYRLHNQVSVNRSGSLRVSGRLFAVTKAEISPDNGTAADGSSTSLGGPKRVSATITAVVFSHGTGAAATTTPASTTSASTTGGTQ